MARVLGPAWLPDRCNAADLRARERCFEKIRDVSPNQKFAMQILYDAEMNQQLIEGEKADSPALKEVLKTFVYLEPKSVQERH